MSARQLGWEERQALGLSVDGPERSRRQRGLASGAHTKDSDCTVIDGECVECGVWHGDGCAHCDGRGFHKPGCVESDGDSDHRDDDRHYAAQHGPQVSR